MHCALSSATLSAEADQLRRSNADCTTAQKALLVAVQLCNDNNITDYAFQLMMS